MADKRLYLNILWHMHQPYYRDDESGRFEMPWVFLHGIKDYYDIPWYQQQHPKIKSTYNLVPSLIVQLEPYADPEVDDRFLKSLRKPVKELEKDERVYLFEMLFFSQYENMIQPIERYARLFRKVSSSKDKGEKAWLLSDEEFLDLEVCFLLSWCGVYLRTNSETVRRLLFKEHFSQEEKLELLAVLAEFVTSIVPLYKNMMATGQIEVSTTPFYHPIMPLLIDMQNARAADPGVLLPEKYADFSSQAPKHIRKAMELYQSHFDTLPSGVWPSEGSIDTESLMLYARSGLLWACSDEEVLFKSLGSRDRQALYRQWRLSSLRRRIPHPYPPYPIQR